MTPRPDLLGLTRPALSTLLEELGVGAVHTERVFSAVHREAPGPLAAVPELGPTKGALLDRHARRATVRVERAVLAEDGTERLVLALRDDERVEAVLIPQGAGRVTLCVSSQVGCAMGCGFCATARLGLRRGMEPGEIVAQVRLARERLQARGERLANIVFMGMGEPLHHYESTRTAIRIITDHFGLMHPLKNITVSTAGLAGRIRQLAADFGGRVRLAISLNAGTQTTRRRLMPIAERWDLDQLAAACADYPLPGSRRFVLIEYVVLPTINDTAAEVAGLVAFARRVRSMVNLIGWNPFEGGRFRSPSVAEMQAVRAALVAEGVPVIIRKPRGQRVGAACGQLALAASPC